MCTSSRQKFQVRNRKGQSVDLIRTFWDLLLRTFVSKVLKLICFSVFFILREVHHMTLGRSIDWIERNIESIESNKCKKLKAPLLKELSWSSWDSFESESDSNGSRDDWFNLPKGCIFYFLIGALLVGRTHNFRRRDVFHNKHACLSTSRRARFNSILVSFLT